MVQEQKKRHHYVPVTYLKEFSDQNGYINVYRKGDIIEKFRSKPEKTGFRKYYYSQISDYGEIDNNNLENIFSEIESVFPFFMTAVRNESDVNTFLEWMFQFLALQRVRVPAARDMIEGVLAKLIMDLTRDLVQSGRCPPPPKPLTLENIVVTIDPQKSIWAMISIVKELGQIFDRMGWRILFNNTERKFATSDNPVIYFDPSRVPYFEKPYNIDNNESQIEFYFPLSSEIIIHGHTDFREKFVQGGLKFSRIESISEIKRINNMIFRYAYEFIYSSDANLDRDISEVGLLSPTFDSKNIAVRGGRFFFVETTFAPRRSKPKWRTTNRKDDC